MNFSADRQAMTLSRDDSGALDSPGKPGFEVFLADESVREYHRVAGSVGAIGQENEE